VYRRGVIAAACTAIASFVLAPIAVSAPASTYGVLDHLGIDQERIGEIGPDLFGIPEYEKSPEADDVTYVFLGFGDSFASGEGAPDRPVTVDFDNDDSLSVAQQGQLYWAGTNLNWTKSSCHRSFNAPFYRHLRNLRERIGSNVIGANFACSGAESMHIVGSNVEWCTVHNRQGACTDGRASTITNPALSDLLRMRVEDTQPYRARGTYSNSTHLAVQRDVGRLHDSDDAEEEWNTYKSGGYYFLDGEEPNVDGFPGEGYYESQLLSAQNYLYRIRQTVPGPVVVIGAYVSAGGNDKSFGPALGKALGGDLVPNQVFGDDIETWWNGYQYKNKTNCGRNKQTCNQLGVYEDVPLMREVQVQPSITFQLEQVYNLIAEWMHHENLLASPRLGMNEHTTQFKMSVSDAIEPFVAVQKYPTHMLTQKNGTYCDETAVHGVLEGLELLENLTESEAQMLDQWLLKPLNTDIDLAAASSRSRGLDVITIDTSFLRHGVCVKEAPDRWVNSDIDGDNANGEDNPGPINSSKASFHPNAKGYEAIYESGAESIHTAVQDRIRAVDERRSRQVALHHDYPPFDWAALECQREPGNILGSSWSSEIYARSIANVEYTAKIGVGGQNLGAAWVTASTSDQFRTSSLYDRRMPQQEDPSGRLTGRGFTALALSQPSRESARAIAAGTRFQSPLTVRFLENCGDVSPLGSDESLRGQAVMICLTPLVCLAKNPYAIGGLEWRAIVGSSSWNPRLEYIATEYLVDESFVWIYVPGEVKSQRAYIKSPELPGGEGVSSDLVTRHPQFVSLKTGESLRLGHAQEKVMKHLPEGEAVSFSRTNCGTSPDYGRLSVGAYLRPSDKTTAIRTMDPIRDARYFMSRPAYSCTHPDTSGSVRSKVTLSQCSLDFRHPDTADPDTDWCNIRSQYRLRGRNP